MKAAITWMAHNRITANLLMAVLIIGGLAMGLSIKQEVFPEITFDLVQVTVAYPGAGPEEVEDGIVLNIEESLSGITGIKEIKSVAAEGYAVVMAEVMPDEDVDLVMLDIKGEVDRITTFPNEAEKPVISKLANRLEVINIVIYGDMPEKSLREYAESVNDELLGLDLITQTAIRGTRPYEISIEVPAERLRSYGLTLAGIAERIKSASVDLPAGSVKTVGGEILVRTKEKRYIGAGYAGITVVRNPDGSEVKLGDIADVRDSFRETDVYATLDGLPAALVTVYRVGEQKPTEISKAVKKYIEERRASLPSAVDLTTLNDTSELLKSRMDLLIKNALIGLVMVFIVLGLFLRVRLAMWVMLGIPISFLGAMLVMPTLDVSINMLSLFAFILALGIVVDDAIVVGENIFEHINRGEERINAATIGAIEVSGPVVFSVLTTVVAFLPLLFIAGTMGKFIKTVPLVVIPILLLSLVESLFILPAHLGHGRPFDSLTGRAGLLERIRLGFGTRLERFVSGPYTRALTLCLKYRYATLAAAVAILLFSAGIVGGGVVKFRFMPKVDGDFITATLQMPIGTPVEETGRFHDMLVAKAQELTKEYDAKRTDGKTMLRNIYSTVGSTIKKGMSGEDFSSGSNYTEVAISLTPSEERGVPAYEVTARWREMVGEIPGADSLVFKSDMVHFGANVDIRLAHDDFGILTAAAARLKAALGDYPGTGDITDNYSTGKRELKLTLTSEGRTLGITERELGRQVRSAFYGAEALRFQRGRNEVKVMVRYPEGRRKSLSDLESMRIRTPSGGEVPLMRAATITEGRGYSAINRTDRKRVLNVTASVDPAVSNAEEILTDLKATVLSDIKDDYPALSIDLEGEDKERRESMGSMRDGFMVALFIMFVLLAIPFGSYSQPLIIMAAIPFGIVGAILGHLIMGFDLSILSMFGLVALSGVLVNDSLLLIDYINRLVKGGVELNEAVVASGRRRFRPIVLTSLTTSLGLTPMILETSVQAQFLIPMAISLGFGILFATGITLLLIPSLYLILEDIRALVGLKPFGHGPARPYSAPRGDS